MHLFALQRSKVIMADVEKYVNNLRGLIASIIENREVWTTLYDVLTALGFQSQNNDAGLGKAKYLVKVTNEADKKIIVAAAKQIIKSYPSSRGKPSNSDLQAIQDNLWWIENNGVQKISNVTRYKIAESIENIPFWGRLSISEFFAPILPNHSPMRVGVDGHLYMQAEGEAFFNSVFSPTSLNPPPISTAEFFRKIGISNWPDERLFLVLERIVHPEIQHANLQQKLVIQFNLLLKQENFELKQEGSEGGSPIYKVRKIGTGVQGTPKYIIFASIGIKPDIVIDDTINMDIRITQHSDQCLVYDQPPPDGDLTWQMLLEWWSKKRGTNHADGNVRQELGMRLRSSLQSEPERIFFDTYFKMVKPKYGIRLPALLPQIYLHYDPRNRNEREKPLLVRQRMDFLLLLRNATRVVIEVDGMQHYAEENGTASPIRYAEMVSEDRCIRILGYEIYRFGVGEIKSDDQKAYQIISTFFDDLFAHHKITPE
jgi:very-short-patch-repair endonuclease